jgi:ADP-ribose pyrophosphatase
MTPRYNPENQKIVFDGSFFKILEREYTLSDNSKRVSYIIDQKNTVVVLALTKDHKIIIVRQYRNGPDRETIELPSGGIEQDETPIQAATRELLEETGFGGKLEYVGQIMNNPGSTSKRHVFVCRLATQIQPVSAKESQFIKINFISRAEFIELVLTGKTLSTDAATIGMHNLGWL